VGGGGKGDEPGENAFVRGRKFLQNEAAARNGGSERKVLGTKLLQSKFLGEGGGGGGRTFVKNGRGRCWGWPPGGGTASWGAELLKPAVAVTGKYTDNVPSRGGR